ncbi:MAG: signal peptidase I [Candidatus Nitrospinota bacterium M3_3B_026]
MTCWRTGLVIAIALAAGAAIPARIGVTVTPSLYHRIYYVRPRGETEIPAKGDYVTFAKPVNGKRELVTKRVACAPGDELRAEGRKYYCSGKYLGEAKKFSLSGAPLENFVFNGKVPEGRLFVKGDHRDSWDSRYFGFVEVDDVEAIQYPIF